jgi:ferredoxin-thioredoxin reductase catalytic chain
MTMEGRPMGAGEALARAQRLARRYAETGPYRLVGDAVVLRTILTGMARNWQEHGLPYCPCKDLSGHRDADRRLVCPCRDHHREIAQTGSCCCGLFWRQGDAEHGADER